MFEIIPSESRGAADHGWLRARHTFSFADYYDPARIEFGSLRVINEDRVAPGKGFGTHPHRDMEIITYVIDGAIEHKDSLGNGTIITPGEIQRMTAGTGVQHSEYNHSQESELHLLQIWIYPEERGLTPGYEQTRFARGEKLNRLRLVGSRDGRDGSVTIHQDVNLYASILEAGAAVSLDVNEDRKVFVQVIGGELVVNGKPLFAGDGAQCSGQPRLEITASSEAEFLVFDMG